MQTRIDGYMAGWINWVGIGFPAAPQQRDGQNCKKWEKSAEIGGTFLCQLQQRCSFSRFSCMQIRIPCSTSMGPHPPWNLILPFCKRQAPQRRCFWFFQSCSTYGVCVLVCVCISCVFLLCAYANMQLSRPGPTLAIERHVCCHLTWHSVSKQTSALESKSATESESEPQPESESESLAPSVRSSSQTKVGTASDTGKALKTDVEVGGTSGRWPSCDWANSWVMYESSADCGVENGWGG